MTLRVDIARVAIVGNLLLLSSLVYVWVRNYLTLRSMHTLGLLTFATFLFVENALALYFYFFEPTLHVWVASVPPRAQGAMTLLRVCEFAALVVLTLTTWR